jgi:signal transduction histidine kinase
VPSLDEEVVKEMHDEMVENLEAIESIQICASHQTRIADGERRPALHALPFSSRRLTSFHLVADILNVSKLNMGLLSINVAPFDIVAAIREVVRTFGTSAQQQEIQLRVDRGESLDRLDVDFIVADAGRLKQVTYNFVSRASSTPATRQTIFPDFDQPLAASLTNL